MDLYKVKNEENIDVTDSILLMYFGKTWRIVLDRLNHKYDGHLITIKHGGHIFRVYRET